MTSAFARIDWDVTHWGEILDTFGDRTLFQTPAWLSFLSKTQNGEPLIAVLKDRGQTLGYFSGVIVKKFGLKILGSPFPGWTTSYMGLNLSDGVPRSLALKALTLFAFKELHCVHLEVMDRKVTIEDVENLGFEYRSYAGFEIDLTQSEDKLFANMSSACRRCIRKAEKNGVTIHEAQDAGFVDEYYAQLQDVFRKQSLVPTYGIDRVRELIAHLLPTRKLLLLRARDADGHCIATGIFPAMNGTMYFWGGASKRQSQYLRPNEAIQWYAMRYWKQRGAWVYDMGGGGEYKRKFGGYEISVPWFRKSKYPWISHMRNIAKRAERLRQECLAKLNHRGRDTASNEMAGVESRSGNIILRNGSGMHLK